MFSKNHLFSQDQGHDLYKAIQSGNEKIVFKLLSYPIHLKDIRDVLQEKSISPLILAIPHSNILKKILENYNNQITSLEKINALNTAIKNNNEKAIPILLQRCKEDIGNEDIIQALVLTIKYENINILNALLNEPSVVSVSAHQNNMALREAKTALNDSNNKKQRDHYKAIINRLIQIPSIALLEAIENKKNEKKIKGILIQNFDNITNESIGFALIKASEINFPQAISILLEHADSQIKEYQKGFALMRAVEKGHLECVDALLSCDSIANIVSWHNHAPLHEAHIQLDKSTGKKRKNHQSIIALLTNTYEKIWDNIELDSLAIRNLKFKIIVDKMRESFIANNENESLSAKINKLDIKVLKFIQQKTSNSYELSNEIILDEHEINHYLDTFSLSDAQINTFINDIKVYFSTTDIESFVTNDVKEETKHELLNFEIKSYSDFIRICANNILKVFPKTISEIIETQLNILDISEKLITPHFENTFSKKRGRHEIETNNNDTSDEKHLSKRARLA